MNFYTNSADKNVVEFLDSLNVEAHDVSIFDVDFVILKAKEYGFIENYEMAHADISDSIYLVIAELLCAFDNKNADLSSIRANFSNIKSFSTTQRGKYKLLNALYDIQNGVVDNGRERVLSTQWKKDGTLHEWQDHIDKLIVQIRSIKAQDDDFSNDRSYIQSIIDEVTKPNYKKRKKRKSEKHNAWYSYMFLSFFMLSIMIVVLSLSNLNYRTQKIFLNFTGIESVGVVTDISVVVNDSKNPKLKGVSYTYFETITYITQEGREITAMLRDVSKDFKSMRIGSQVKIVYSKSNPYLIAIRSPYIDIYRLGFYVSISFIILFFVFCALKLFVLNYLKSSTLKTVISFTLLSVALLAATTMLIFEKRYEFYRYLSARNLDDFSVVDGVVFRKNTKIAFSGRIKEKSGNSLIMRSYKNGRLDGLSILYEGSTIRMVSNYREGYKNGLFVQYTKSGDLLEYGSFSDGRLNGIMRKFDALSGHILYEGVFISGRKIGTFRTYYTNGTLMREEQYLDGKLNGVYREFNLQGGVERVAHFTDGNLNGRYKVYDGNGNELCNELVISGKFKGKDVSLNTIDDLIFANDGKIREQIE